MHTVHEPVNAEKCLGVKKLFALYAGIVSKKDVQASPDEDENKPFGVRLPNHLRHELRRLAADMEVKEGQCLSRCAELVIVLINAPKEPLTVPFTIKKIRHLSRYGVTADAPPDMFDDTMVLSVMPAQPKSDSSEVAGKTSKRARKRSVPA